NSQTFGDGPIIFLIHFSSPPSLLPPVSSPGKEILPRGVISATLRSTFQSPTSKYSISDRDLESRGFFLRRTISGLNFDHLNSVFVAVGFPRRDPEKIKLALEHTDSLLWVEYSKTQKPVAFARATGDGVFNVIIWDEVVDPSFQGMGLGKAVMERLIEELLQKGICNVALYSEPRVLGFYRPLGFVADPDGIRGMVYSRKQRKKK
ncbi:hypothetical protein SLEP1_g59288, partial [Rubroshorea leprosula]